MTSNPSFSDQQQMFAAGFLEGSLTHRRISQFWEDAILSLLSGSLPLAKKVKTPLIPRGGEKFISLGSIIGISPYPLQDLIDFFKEHYTWLKTMATSHHSDPYWAQIELVLEQVDGLRTGFNEHCTQVLCGFDFVEMLIFNSAEDLPIVMQALFSATDPDRLIPWFDPSYFGNSTFNTYAAAHESALHCSSLIKLTDQALFTSHDTWSSYLFMIRIFKRYTLPLSLVSTKSKSVLFSGYPGILVGMDDFYVLDTELTVLETTNEIFNQSLLSEITPKTAFTWLRTIVANRMTNGGQEWGQVFAQHNSGTYNNQWMIVDYKLYQPGMKVLKSNTVWIAEQMPGLVLQKDVTPFINAHGYWASYNVPYFPEIFNRTGYGEMVSKYGNVWSWSECPRAKIFRRDQHKVDTLGLPGMMQLMRENDYTKDPLSQDNPGYAISSRFDLEQKSPFPFGGIDSKITSDSMVKGKGASDDFSAIAIGGPTHESLPVFDWSFWLDLEYPHFGQPSVWKFPWQTMVVTEES